MKANAPEKIYVKITHPISDEYTEMIAFEDGDGIEYVHKDAFIERASKFIKDNGNFYIDIVNEQLVLKRSIIKDFIKYMKGE